MHKRWDYGSDGKLHLIGMNLACMLRIYRTCNSTVRFSKYKFYNKLLGGVTLFRVTPFFNGCKFGQIHHWIILSSYILHACKISR